MSRYSKPATVMLYVRVPAKIHKELVDQAAAEDRPISQIAARILAVGLAEQQKGGERPRRTSTS
jgi:hypothetical protein